MENKLLIVCGPTATGKTNLGIGLAKRFRGEVVSADSRQVYKYMNIGTGKDIPQGSEWRRAQFSISDRDFTIGYWETKSKTRLWGYDIVEPSCEFSVGQYGKSGYYFDENIQWKPVKHVIESHRNPRSNEYIPPSTKCSKRKPGILVLPSFFSEASLLHLDQFHERFGDGTVAVGDDWDKDKDGCSDQDLRKQARTPPLAGEES